MGGARVGVVVLIGLVGGSVAAGAPLRPDLVVTAVSVRQQGDSLRVSYTVRNRGSVTAPSSTSGYYLAHTRIGSRTVGRLAPGATARASTRVTIPARLAPGSYRLVVCADAGSRVREPDERDNCRAAARAVVVRDRTPPSFAGLERAVTCIPGPVDGTRTSRYTLQWKPATDAGTPASQIVYEIYQANTPGGEDLSAPTYRTAPGATSFATPLLPDDVTYYFIVRARDRAGNIDANTVERAGANLCL